MYSLSYGTGSTNRKNKSQNHGSKTTRNWVNIPGSKKVPPARKRARLAEEGEAVELARGAAAADAAEENEEEEK